MADNIKNLGKVCITPEGVWDVNKEYDRLSLVVTKDSDTQRVLSYISRKHVPKGNISIHDREYWQLFTTELRLEDITIDENGNIKMGDVVIYQIPLGDALGEIVVDKIKEDLTNHIMTEIRSYMTSMVQELINSFSTQIGRLITEGIKVANNINGTMHNVDEVTHYGTVNLKHDGKISGILSGSVNSKVSGELYINGDEPTPSTKYLVTVNADPSDAVVTLNGVETNSAEFDEGSTVTVIVSKSGYVTKTESITNLQQDTTLNVILVEEDVQYFFRINPTEKSVGAVSSEFTVNVESVKNNQRYEYEYIAEDSDDIIQSITKVTGGVKIITNSNALDRTKTATIYFKQHRPEEEVQNVTIPFIITQETDNPSEYIFISEAINRMNATSEGNGLNGIPVTYEALGYGTSEKPYFDLVSTKNNVACDYNIIEKPSWINIIKDLDNNKLIYTLEGVALSTPYSIIKGTIVLEQVGSKKQLKFTLIRANHLLYVIGNPFSFNDDAHYSEKLRVISCVCQGEYAFIPSQPNLDENDEHPNWINITAEDLRTARLVSYTLYPTSSYYEVPISIQPNTGDTRTGEVRIINDDNTAKYTIRITQTDGDYVFTINPISAEISANGDTINPTIVSTKNGSEHNFTIFSTVVPNWIHVTKTGNDVTIIVDSNTGNARNYSLAFKQNDSDKTINFEINQAAGSTPTPIYTFSVSPTVTSMKADGSSVFNPTVTSTKDGAAQSFSVDAKSDWLNVGIENNIVTITANENTGSSRLGFVRFIQNESGQTCGINITQQGTDTFEIDGSSVANISADALNTTLNVTSIVGGQERSPYTVESSPEWITATPNVQISKLGLQIAANTGAARTGQVVCKQTATDETVTITVNQAAGSTPTHTYEFVGILTGSGGDTEQPLDTAIRLTTADNSVTLTPRVKIDGQLREDINVNITFNGFSQGAQNTNKFSVNSSGTALTISTSGEEPSEPISTSYDIALSYDGHTENATFAIDWDV